MHHGCYDLESAPSLATTVAQFTMVVRVAVRVLGGHGLSYEIEGDGGPLNRSSRRMSASSRCTFPTAPSAASVSGRPNGFSIRDEGDDEKLLGFATSR